MWKKIITWIPKNIGSIIGIIQAILKCIKEVLTLLANIIMLPQGAVDKIRAIINVVDDICEKIKSFLLKVGI